MGKGHSFQNLLLGKLNMHKIKRKKKFDPYITPDTKINSKWIKDLNLRDKTTRVLKQNVGLNLCDVDLVNNFLDMTTKA